VFVPYLDNSQVTRQDKTLWSVKHNVLNRQTVVVVFHKQRSTRS